MRRFARPLAPALALLLLLGLILLATNAVSHSHAGVVRLFAFSLFVSLGFLLFGPQRFEPPAQAAAAQTGHSA